MELKWLEDFLALAKHGSFSKAAAARFVTQPAFSRRIRSLENWLGVSLVDRTRYPTSFTEAGLEFLEQAESLRTQIYGCRDQLKSMASDQDAMVMMSQHSLAVSFLPNWLQSIEPLTGDALVKVNAGNLHDSLESFLAGTGDFLLCFSSPDIFNQLEREDIECIQVGTDRLVPVTAVKADGEPVFSVSQQAPLRLLSYPKESFFGRLILRECMPQLEGQLETQKVCENALAEGLKALVEKGFGIAWLPRCLVEKELSQGSMAILDAPMASVDLTIKLYRFKGTHSAIANTFWHYLAELYNPGYS
ncbi:LysR family transcriptional regulator [Motiliproteus coralliicola]|uniref:LysR family transcriptional regulator n=1 Tax=Motiliproteus coralliicola TaxID=2283196 RepID=A0A369WP53_9GAMM|nr:LysR substrate-binding domain-containing protein [Motiliproteus coralliicola]RDE22849.1 LysR family transcriptional regulator [Motiliproteus coralliicola]